jgi:hypothetical protein
LVFLFVRRTPFRVRDDMPPRLRSAGIPEPDTRA